MINFITPNFLNKYSSMILYPVSILCVLLFGIGLYYGLIISPEDYQQGEMVRVMYVHVPAAWMALGIYVFIGICSLLSIVWKNKMAYIMAISAAPIGAAFAAITLITGSLWGKPMWGAWWVWDARLTSMFILFLLYLAYMAVSSAGDNIFRAEKPAGLVALLGVINVPIVKFSVDLWHSLHQPASVIRSGGTSIDNSMLKPLLIMFLAYILYFLALVLVRSKAIMLKIKNNR